MNFNQFNLDSRLMNGIEKAGFRQATPVQAQAIPQILAGHDLIGTAQTGTGKTAAFVLPILHQMLQQNSHKGVRALVLTPTRELAEQIHQAIRSFGQGTRLRSVTLYGGVSSRPQIQALRSGVDIIVACPGRLLDLMDQGQVDLSALNWLVLDEADRMLDMGFFPSVRRILQHVPKDRQTLLFSATFPAEIEKLAAQALHKPQRVTLGLSRPVHTVQHALFPVDHEQKMSLLLSLLKRTPTESVLIFARTRYRAQRVAQQIGRSGYRVTSLHSDRTQGQRQAALNGFRSGKFQIMVATDIAARGLDVETISHVINFDMPDTADAFIHRIGRTGRAERCGSAFTFSTPKDNALVQSLEKIMGERLPRRSLKDVDSTQPAPVPKPLRVEAEPASMDRRSWWPSKRRSAAR
ncbi:DEAD/DEAH box helicase [candidate division KSB1 bacterium]|nr:DEAD/DEAH box helicase [candidate division KSB1 bacterium]